MKALILSTATGGGHNTAAHAVMEALTERGVECRFEDCVAFGGQKLSAAVSNVYVKFVQAAPDAFGRLYRFAKAISTPRIKSPVYLFNAAYARKMDAFLRENGYENDFTAERLHHEIYLSDPRKTAAEKRKTVIRHPVRKV